jgi:predicted enzyme related to lactoylglutathione lyase
MSLFGHIELHSKNPKGAREFYSGVFGWTYDEVPMPGGVYVMIRTAEGEQVGGIVKKQDKKAPEAWVGYITVPSVKRTMGKAVRRKARVVLDYTKVPGMGAYAVLKDPRGGYFGLWEQAKPTKKKASKKKSSKKKASKKKASKKKTTRRKASRRR